MQQLFMHKHSDCLKGDVQPNYDYKNSTDVEAIEKAITKLLLLLLLLLLHPFYGPLDCVWDYPGEPVVPER